MTTVGQLEIAIRDWMRECEIRMGDVDSCPECPYEHFCDRLRFPFDILPSEWEVDDADS